MKVNIDKRSSKLLAEAVKKAVENTVGKDFGLSVRLKGGTIDEGNSLIVRVELRQTNEDGSAKNEFEDEFKKCAEQFGLKPEHLFAEITYGRERYKIIGLNANRYALPLHVERIRDKKRFFVPTRAAKELMSKEDGGSFLDREAPPSSIRNRFDAMKKAGELLRDAPENYYMDGELKAQGKSEKQIREYWIQRFMAEGQKTA